ncbi:MAG: deoxynucleoside kinase [Bacteroidota bacterium]|nr:deoxynucleoside kinase [Bacteroidota bacterium]MDP4233137.1 deoxynucleoside kinase [Bacteroidota bacterium]MDP4241718.1 deoxynucleoside kinase [Bacteroidota bacterium]MDP4287376.1 deoxynucleoside kinase [Bacteroidota bacterium]
MTEENAPRYIAVEGAIGAGKTTLAKAIAARIDAQPVLERFEENPFLSNFYEDPKRLAFQTQIFFLLSRYRQQRELLQPDLFVERWTSDYIFAKDRIFASINLSDDELKLYEEIEQTLNREIPLPDVVIYLQAGVPSLLENIQKRGRDFEKQISREYLHSVVEAYNHFFYHYRATRLIVVDSNRMDFAHNPEHVDLVIDAIYRDPHPPVEYISVVDEKFFSL